MSRIVATLVYSKRVGSMSRKAVLAYFAERANDDGTAIWASKQRIADEIECSRKNVIATVNGLVEDGLLVEAGKKRHRNGFTVLYNMDMVKINALPDAATIANQSPEVTSEICDGSPEVTPRRNQRLHKPSLNRPLSETKVSSRKAAKQFPKPDGVEQDIWNDFVDCRKAKRAPVSNTALAAIVREAAKAGWSLNDALAEIVARNWQSFKAEWVVNNGNDGRNSNNSGRNGRQVDGFTAALRHVSDGPLDEPFGNYR